MERGFAPLLVPLRLPLPEKEKGVRGMGC